MGMIHRVKEWVYKGNTQMERWNERWPEFKPSEVLSPEHYNLWLRTGVISVNEFAMDALCAFRRQLELPLLCNYKKMHLRGTRSYKENRSLPNPEEYSSHLLGLAFDLTCPDLTVEALAEQAYAFGWKGIGVYNTWVHVDRRNSLVDARYLWDRRSIKVPLSFMK